jgi:hypothetical protein
MQRQPISVQTVKYRDMPGKQWYMSPRHTDWYYHTPRVLPSSDLDAQFLDATLDPPIRLLSLGLNSLGYTTLPSCSGHYKSDEEVDEAYSNLVEDARQIRKGGIELIDTENGNRILHSDPTWYLPWDRAKFKKLAMGSDAKPEGYLGFEVPKADAYAVGSVVESAVQKNKGCRYEVKRTPSGYTFELRVYTGKPKSQDAAWQCLGDDVMDGLTSKKF